MAKRQRLVTEYTDTAKTASIINNALHVAIEAGGERGPLARLTVREVAGAAALVLYALGEVYEQQFYPSDREQCQEVARTLLGNAGMVTPPGLLLPDAV
jgi:hypothetical protein